MARLSRTGSRIQGFRRIAAGEAARRQDTQEGLWFGDGPGAGVVPASDLRMAAISTRVADAINMTCFTPPLGGAGWPGTHRSVYQLVTVARACTISLVEMGFMYPPAQPYPGVWNWAQVSIYANDGVAGTPLTLLGRCVPIPLAALSTDDCIDFVLPLWVPITVTAGQSIWIGVSPKAYSGPAEPVWTDEHGAYYIDARGTRTVGDLDFIKSRFSEPDPITGLGAHGPDWEDYDDKHLWVRLYEHPEALALQHTQAAPPPTSRVGIRSIIARPVEGELESACAAGIRPGMGTLPWDLAGGSGRAGGGGGATGNVNAPLPLVAGEVVYATGVTTVATDAGFTFNAVTGEVSANTLRIATETTAQGISFSGGIGTANFTHIIHPETVDAADDHLVTMMGGGAQGPTRGAHFSVCGNEYGVGNYRGMIILAAGVPGTAGTYDGHIRMDTGGAVTLNLHQDGNMALRPDTDVLATLGRVKIGFYGSANVAGIAHFDFMNATDFAFAQGSSGATIMNAPTGSLLYLRIANTGGFRMSNTALYPATAHGMALGGVNNELGDVFIGSNHYIRFGDAQQATIGYDTGDACLKIRG